MVVHSENGAVETVCLPVFYRAISKRTLPPADMGIFLAILSTSSLKEVTIMLLKKFFGVWQLVKPGISFVDSRKDLKFANSNSADAAVNDIILYDHGECYQHCAIWKNVSNTVIN